MADDYWTPGEPVVIDLVRRPAAEVAWSLVLGGGVVLVGGVISIGNAGVTGAKAAVVAVSAVCLIAGLVQLGRRMFRLRVRGLFVEPGGIALEESGGRSWSVAWDELASISIATERRQGGDWLAVELVPAGSRSQFEAAHPGLSQFRFHNDDGDSYRVPVGPGGKHFVALERGLVTYAQARYREPYP